MIRRAALLVFDDVLEGGALAAGQLERQYRPGRRPDSIVDGDRKRLLLRSRGAARRELDLAGFRAQMQGRVWQDRDAQKLIDEAPEAYKPMDVVMADSATLVDTVTVLRAIITQACSLTGVRTAAIGVIVDPERPFSPWIEVNEDCEHPDPARSEPCAVPRAALSPRDGAAGTLSTAGGRRDDDARVPDHVPEVRSRSGRPPPHGP